MAPALGSGNFEEDPLMRMFPAAVAAVALIAAPAAAGLVIGAKAPTFATRGAIAGKVVNVDLAQQLKKGPVVLYFFPAAFTGGCNAEAHAFAEAVPDFQKAGATVIGMSADDVPTLQRFSAEKCAGKFAVASAGPAVIKNYDVGLAASGRTMTKRTSYVIGRDGRVAYVHDDMNPAQHVALTLAAVRKLGRS
jgi:peroxiredoxin Q/BCP